jgi:dynein heavy chain
LQVLDPVLEKRIVKSGKGFKIALADKEVDYSPSFQLYLTTRLPNPHFTPELSAKVGGTERNGMEEQRSLFPFS